MTIGFRHLPVRVAWPSLSASIPIGQQDDLSSAHFADRERSFRSIVNTRFGDRDRSGATLDGVSFACCRPFVETLPSFKHGNLLSGTPRVRLALVSKTGEKLLEDALKLALSERAELAAELLASLDGAADADAEVAWATEIERRADRARSGADPGRLWPEARDRIRNGLAKR